LDEEPKRKLRMYSEKISLDLEEGEELGMQYAIAMLKIISEPTSDTDRELYASFINCHKTSDRVNGRKLV
jgi:hypothetical protein